MIWYPIVMFSVFLAVYHCIEYFLQWMFNRELINKDAWLFSTSYCYAIAASYTEYLIESTMFPNWKSTILSGLFVVGLFFAIIGFGIRVVAIVTAGKAFTHEIQVERRKEHKLVTGGVYRYCRHPGYFGWFVWSIATQIMLGNLLSIVGFAIASWKFFADRIPFEEDLLIEMFGKQYVEYRDRTPTLLPFIS
eukprot:ANDGO_03834.mRNA.1 putative protein-S-isoprenylcysteine O-methyltransferase